MASGTIQGVKTLTPTFTKTSGRAVLSTVNAVQAGHTIQVSFDFGSEAGNINAGDNFVVGTLSGIPLPRTNINGCGYASTQLYNCLLKPDGSMTIRVIGTNRTIPSTASGVVIFGFVYVA